MRISDYWHTLRYLKRSQTLGRLRFLAASPRPELRPAPSRRAIATSYVEPIARASSLVGPFRFRFLGREHLLPAFGGWDDPELPKLWRYNLHYFDDLNGLDSEVRIDWHQSLVARWIRENPPGTGTGWEPYPTSLRIVNWVKAAARGASLSGETILSLAVQARWLSQRIEHHLLGNHLLANAKALVHVGVFFGGTEGDKWLTSGLRLWQQQLPEQVLADGGHFELSPMYHAIVLEDLLDTLNILRTYGYAEPDWRSTISQMRNWLAAMSHPDGEISFFNDAAYGIAPRSDDLNTYAARLKFECTGVGDRNFVQLVSSGYARIESGDAVSLLDCAAVGPDYLPAHAHADTLSFELSLFGQRVFVNSGTSEYGIGAERQRQRGTAAHNTVVIDDADSSEVWAEFRVARRARPGKVGVRRVGDLLAITCSHDGYKRLRTRNGHERTWEFAQNSMKVVDRITGEFRSAVARFHLHPDIAIADDGSGSFRLKLPGGRIVTMLCEGATDSKVAETTWHPSFGLRVPNKCIAFNIGSRNLITIIAW